MAGPDEGKKEGGQGKPSHKGKQKPGERVDAGKRQANLIRALDHRVRRLILRSLHDSGEPQSPARLAKALGQTLSTVSYHVGVLKGLEAVKRVEEREVRGTVEHFYVSEVGGDEVVLTLLATTRESDEPV